MGSFLFLKFLNLLLVPPQLFLELLDALALLGGHLRRYSNVLIDCAAGEHLAPLLLHALEERALVDAAQIRWHHAQVLQLGDHG